LPDFLPALIGALVGGSVTMLANIGRARFDLYQARYYKSCDEIVLAADKSVIYWLLEVDSDPSLKREGVALENYKRAEILEIEIEGLQQQILLSDEYLRPELSRDFREQVNSNMKSFIDALTGSDFKSRNGTGQKFEAAIVRYNAATLIESIRSGVHERYQLSYVMRRIFHQH